MSRTRSEASRSNYWVPILGSAIKILDVFYEAESDLTLHEISKRAKVGKTSAFRILYTLDNVGYVEKDPVSGRYRLGVGIVAAARKTLAGGTLVEIARPYLKRLRDEFGETANLAALLKDDIVYLEIYESLHSFRMTDTVGSRVRWHSTGLGKSIAAYLPEDRVKALLKQAPMKRLTPNTITGLRGYLKVLTEVKEQGYAVDMEESELGATCIAAPIFGAEQAITGALSISGPTPRIVDKQSKIIQSLKASAMAISRILNNDHVVNRR